MLSTAFERQYNKIELEESKNNFENFFNMIDDLIIIGNTRGNILYANRAVKSKLGYSIDELLRMNIIDLYPSGMKEEVNRIIRQMFRREKNSCSILIESKNRKIIPVESRAWLGCWNNQDCIFVISEDLSREQELLQKFTKLFENNPALMTISDLTERRFIDVNASFLEKTGYTGNEVIGRTLEELKL